MSTKTVFCFFSATILTFLLCGCGYGNEIALIAPIQIEEIPETSSVCYEFESAGVEAFFADTLEDVETYNPASELDEAQSFLVDLGFEIDEYDYEDEYEGQDCFWFHFGSTIADGGVIYCDNVFYIDYAMFLSDGSLDAAESFRCSPGELLKILAEITVNEEPS